MNKRTLNVISLIVNLTVFIVVAYSIAHNFRTDIIHESDWFDFYGFLSLRYFTNLSNIFAAVSCAVILFFNVKNVISDEYFFPLWAVRLKFVAASAIAVTFTTVTVFLSPLIAFNGKSYFYLFEGNGFFVHFFTPVAVISGFILTERVHALKLKDALLGLLPTAVYSAVYIVMVVALKVWPDFYAFTFNGNYRITPIALVVMWSAAFGLSALIYYLRKKIIAE